MKRKMFLTAICLTLATFAFAQGRNGQAGQRVGNRGGIDVVVDTAIINQMGLSEAVVSQVVALQQTMQAKMRQQMQQQQGNKGQRLTDEERKDLQQKRVQFTENYRKELRAILGDQTYITYLEKQLDRRGQFNGARPAAQQQQRQQQAQQQRMQMQRQMQLHMGDRQGEDF